MPLFTVSVLSNVTISSHVTVTADNQADALALVETLHSQGALIWTYGNVVIPTFSGTITSIWSNPGVPSPSGSLPVDTVLTVSSVNPDYNTSVTLTDNIAPGATGLVSFYSGATLLAGGVVPNVVTGIAQITVIPPNSGIQAVKAVYAGDVKFLPDISNVVQINVKVPSTTTTISSFTGIHTTLTASVTSNAGVPDGLVIFYNGANQIGTNILSEGVCGINIDLSSGTYSIEAKYQGSVNFSASHSTIIVVVP